MPPATRPWEQLGSVTVAGNSTLVVKCKDKKEFQFTSWGEWTSVQEAASQLMKS
jgi:hypothetical protein